MLKPEFQPGTVSVVRIVLKTSNVIEICYNQQVDLMALSASIKANGYYVSGPEGIFIPYENIEGVFVFKPGADSQVEMKPLREKMN